MDGHFPETDAAVREELAGIARATLHAPFNELFPCAIDPRARALAADRFREAIVLAKRYGAEKVVIHGGYNPRIYFPCWYTEQSVIFWREFLNAHPGDYEICLENVMEEEPETPMSNRIWLLRKRSWAMMISWTRILIRSNRTSLP